MHVVTPDLPTNPQEGTMTYDVVVVGVTHKDGFKGAPAARAEKKNTSTTTTTRESAETKETQTQD
jgi:hypothetical protein